MVYTFGSTDADAFSNLEQEITKQFDRVLSSPDPHSVGFLKNLLVERERIRPVLEQ